MKKQNSSKLKLNKFTISKLNRLQNIRGGFDSNLDKPATHTKVPVTVITTITGPGGNRPGGTNPGGGTHGGGGTGTNQPTAGQTKGKFVNFFD